MQKKYIKLNNNNNHLSLGNFCRIIKEQTKDKSYANQTNIFCALFNLDTANESTINNYCLGCRAISNNYKEQYQTYKKKYQKDKNIMNPIITNLISILEGFIYTNEYENIETINNNISLKNLCKTLYNIAKNDSTVENKFTKKIHSLLIKNTYNECISEIIFYIILDKKQPIYIENIVNDTISNILINTNISLNALETFLKLQFSDGTNYIYSIKKLAKQHNPYACFELGMLEYKGEITQTPRYNKSYEYFKIAASYNHPRATYLIAKLLLDKKIGTNSKEDINLALKYLNTAINLGSTAALNTMGLYHLNNLKDESTAIIYFEKAIKQNYVYAYNNLGKIYENKKDYIKAFNHYIKSATLEESWACNKIAEMYRIGLGCNKDLYKAFYYYNLSLESPINEAHLWAKYNLAKYFYLNGNYEANIEKSEAKAISLLTTSSNFGLIEASIELLYYYTTKYFNTKSSETLTLLNNLTKKIEEHKNFNNNYKKEIEQTISNLKTKPTINKDLYQF